MIVSHRHRFIFVKTHKTAGSSLEMALGALCGPEDIISHMEDNLGSGIPRNYLPATGLGALYGRSRLVRKLVHRDSPRLGAYFYEHMSAQRIRALVGARIWSEYFTFCVERNPWDKLVSYYLWKTEGQGRRLPPFRDWVLGPVRRLPLDADLYFDARGPMVQQVFEFRALANLAPVLEARTGLRLPAVLPAEKTGIAAGRAPWPSFYDAETRARVAELYAREIALMGYRFESL